VAQPVKMIMSEKANPFKVGVFVVAGIALVIVAVLVLGGRNLFTRQVTFVLYFADSVNGLVVGSPVKFKGAPIGTVTRIQLALRESAGPQVIPVHIRLEEGLILSAAGQPVDIRQRPFVEAQIRQGLRASLELESFITGRLFVQFDYYTNAPPPVLEQNEGGFMELPTISTGLNEFLNSLERVDLAGLPRRLNTVLDEVERLLQDAQVEAISQRLDHTLEAVEKLVESPEWKEAAQSVTRTSIETRRLVADLRAEVRPVASGLTNATDKATETLVELRRTLEELRGVAGADSPLVGELNDTLTGFSDAARSIRLLAEYFNRNPHALLGGRKLPEPKP
jgi:paraquat-inducible protein B